MSDDAQDAASPGQVPPPGPPPGYLPGGYPPPKHPESTIVLVLGILGIIACQVVAPIAWVMGTKALREIDANPTAFSGRSEVNAGRIMGIVGTVLLGLLLLLFVGAVVGMIAFSAGTFEYSNNY